MWFHQKRGRANRPTTSNTPNVDKQLELFDFYESEANRLMAAERRCQL